MDETRPHAPEADESQTGQSAEAPAAYRVLARKYRPENFDDLVGQGAMVRTLSNAFETGRIAQAYMMTGVRGVGKTTTARILARALNFVEEDGSGRPNIALSHLGVHCQAIMEGRHVDVMEMDAASHTGINDIREIIDSVQYKPVSARYKVYIIDEVHMLSTAAFNGLLKTLEEPPEHVKFIFATTEIRKVPITVLSRCQRFDLRRIDADDMTRHLRRIAEAEKVEIEDEGLQLVARAAEGSVRDALSILDQAIAHAAGHITADSMRQMLGLADRARIIDLFENVMKGDIAAALAELKSQYDIGADPAVILNDLSSFVHFVTKLKLVPDSAHDASISDIERKRGEELAQKLGIRYLSRAWQILLKGGQEVQNAPKPLAAADMVLVRLTHAADLPSPDEVLRKLQAGPPQAPQAASSNTTSAPSGGGHGGSGPGPAMRAISGGRAGAAPARVSDMQPMATPGEEPVMARLKSFADLINLAAEKREVAMKIALEANVRPVKMEPGRLEINLTPEAPRDLVNMMGRKLQEWTGTRWVITVSREEGDATHREKKQAEHEQRVDDARADPLVASVLTAFPDAMIVDVRVFEDEDDLASDILPVPSSELDDDDEGHHFDLDFE